VSDSVPAQSIRVWDPLVRVVHWSVACLVIVDMVNDAGANPWHRYFGYAAGALVAARLAWGVFGSPYARLAAMAKSARRVVPYLTSAAARAAQRAYPGHNPPGACMSFALWTLVLAAVATGWMLQLEPWWGDDTVETVHAVFAYALAACAVAHVAGVLATSVARRTNLVKSMITGVKAPASARVE
jgi:cytochrome b